MKTKLSVGNIIKAINTWAVPAIQYSVGIIDWAQAELDILDKKKPRKLMTMLSTQEVKLVGSTSPEVKVGENYSKSSIQG